MVIGVDPLARQYQHACELTPGLLILASEAGHIPLLDDTADIVVSINALDHFHHPYDALAEMYRICKPGGHLLLSTDIDGTPRHPVKVRAKHLDQFFQTREFVAIEREAGLHVPNDWPKEMEIPAYVFHGIKKADGAPGRRGAVRAQTRAG